MPLRFTGTAHPAPGSARIEPADLSGAEIRGANLGRRGRSKNATPVLVEHDTNSHVGSVLASWAGTNGELRVTGSISDPKTERAIRSGEMLGLSLGTRLHHAHNDANHVVNRSVEELSVVEIPRRPGSYIDHIDDRRVDAVYDRASKAEGEQ